MLVKIPHGGYLERLCQNPIAIIEQHLCKPTQKVPAPC